MMNSKNFELRVHEKLVSGLIVYLYLFLTLVSVTHVIIVHGLVINIEHSILILPFLASSTLFAFSLLTIVEAAASYINRTWGHASGLVVIEGHCCLGISITCHSI